MWCTIMRPPKSLFGLPEAFRLLDLIIYWTHDPRPETVRLWALEDSRQIIGQPFPELALEVLRDIAKVVGVPQTSGKGLDVLSQEIHVRLQESLVSGLQGGSNGKASDEAGEDRGAR